MFWKMSYADTSPIDAVLERADFTLEDLLDEDHIIQESKGENEKLLAYLTKEDVLAQLIQCARFAPAALASRCISRHLIFADTVSLQRTPQLRTKCGSSTPTLPPSSCPSN